MQNYKITIIDMISVKVVSFQSKWIYTELLFQEFSTCEKNINKNQNENKENRGELMRNSAVLYSLYMTKMIFCIGIIQVC